MQLIIFTSSFFKDLTNLVLAEVTYAFIHFIKHLYQCCLTHINFQGIARRYRAEAANDYNESVQRW